MIARDKPLRVFVISKSDKGFNAVKELLSFDKNVSYTFAKSGGEARRIIMSEEFDIAIVNAPLGDEFGDSLCTELCETAFCETIMLVKSDLFDEVSYTVGEYGVLTISKPVSKVLFHQTYMLAVAGRRRSDNLRKENKKLLSKIEEIKLVERAKWALMQKDGMDEQQAHRYIEKRAMDSRLTRYEVARDIIATI